MQSIKFSKISVIKNETLNNIAAVSGEKKLESETSEEIATEKKFR